MTRGITNSWSATPLHGVILLGVVAMLVNFFVSARHLWTHSNPASGDCVYQVFQSDECLGTIFLTQPEDISTVMAALGVRSPDPQACGKVPCNRAIRLDAAGATFSVEKIQGRHLIAVGKRIDVNLADHRDLKAVPGVGPKLSVQIIMVRNSRGGFKSVEDLQQVPGIGPKKLAQMSPYLEAGPLPVGNKFQYVESSSSLFDPPGSINK